MANRLASEKSPYLLQHAENPVHWQPWGEAAFAQARAEQKPIFLSIGYSTCHWCHVMAHESFESEEVAALLNTHFVSIKVDREERPDVDRVYMHYVQAMTGHGGWPLSAWLTPELHPFFGGTYFSLEDRNGRAGFKTILTAIAKGWATERAKFVGESARVLTALREQAAAVQVPVSSEGDLTELAGDAFEKCFHYFYENFDGPNGGFGGAPKFPRASNINFLFRAATIQGIDTEAGTEAVTMAVETLKKMACGGIHDHVGGGFHRYSVDEAWFVPHFEKMLYDQAQIAINYLEAKQATGDEAFAWVARGIFEYTQRELASPLGGFYSAEDADSDAGDGHKIEGAFYVWTKAELDELLGEKSALVCAHFGVIESGNVPAQLDPQGELSGKNVLMQRQSLADTAKLFGLELASASEQLVQSLAVLREARGRRARPHLDDKIITAWNGLMISALAKGAQVLGEASLAAAATRAAEFLHSELYDAGTGILYRSYRHGRSEIQGFAEDYAYLVQGLIDLYETTFEIRWLQWAEQLQQTLDTRFGDETGGGYFNSRAGDEAIVLRLKEDYDGAEPTPSSVGAMNHLRLAAISVDGDRLRARARQTLLAFRPRWTEQPQALPQMLCAMEMALEVPRQVVLAGEPASAAFRAMTTVLHAKLGARRVVLAADGGAGQAWLGERVAALKAMTPVGGQVAAYVCEHYTCAAPVTDPAALAALLRG